MALAVRITRHAISPRLAIRIFLNKSDHLAARKGEGPVNLGRFQRLRNLTIEILACYRSRDWEGALEAIERGRKTDEAKALELLYNLYEVRIRGYQENPPPEDWNGAFALLTK